MSRNFGALVGFDSLTCLVVQAACLHGRMQASRLHYVARRSSEMSGKTQMTRFRPRKAIWWLPPSAFLYGYGLWTAAILIGVALVASLGHADDSAAARPKTVAFPGA